MNNKSITLNSFISLLTSRRNIDFEQIIKKDFVQLEAEWLNDINY